MTREPEEASSDLAQVGNHFPADKDPARLDDEQLATLVAERATKLAVFAETLKPYYLELRVRFRDKKSKTAKIHGCATWDEYCEKVLDRSRRAINYWLAGGNPGNEKAKQERRARIKEGSINGEPTDESGSPSFAIAVSPIDGDAARSKQDFPQETHASNFSSPERKRETTEDVPAKPRDEMEFEAPLMPPIAGNPVPKPARGMLEEIRQMVHGMADTEDIKCLLKETFSSLVDPILRGHPHGPVSMRITVAINRPNNRRIEVGDWLEFGEKAKPNRLVEQIGSQRALGRVVGKDVTEHPQVRWHSGERWLGETYSLLDPNAVRVLFDWKAEENHPEAFRSYPQESAANQDVPEQPAPAATTTEAVAAVVESEVADGLESDPAYEEYLKAPL